LRLRPVLPLACVVALPVTLDKASMMCSLNEEESTTLKESMAETLDKTRKDKK
jgi:hypothetical protein